MQETNTRRGFFRRVAIVGAVAAAIGGLGWKAYAQGGGWHRGHHGPLDPATLDTAVERMLKHLYVEIEATEAQKEKIAPIVKSAARDLLPLRDKMHAARASVIGLLKADTVDRAAIERLRGEQVANADQASRRFTQALADLAEVLTPAQRKELAAHLGRRHGRWGHG
jgi:periplasmic protein CpxP/Spy